MHTAVPSIGVAEPGLISAIGKSSVASSCKQTDRPTREEYEKMSLSEVEKHLPKNKPDRPRQDQPGSPLQILAPIGTKLTSQHHVVQVKVTSVAEELGELSILFWGRAWALLLFRP